MIKRRSVICLIFCLLVSFFLTGCPRVAYVEIYNNTSSVLLVDSHGEKYTVTPNQSGRIILGYSLNVQSALGVWHYGRNVPHSGKNGDFFDGTLTVQIETDGKAFVVKKGDVPPVSVSDYEQPEGYPLLPD